MSDAAEEIQALRAALAAAEARATAAEAQALEAARDRAVLSGAEALIAALRLEIEKLRRALYGARSERKARLLDQLELQLEELEAAATEDELAAEVSARAGAPASLVRAHRGTGRKPFPAHLPRERVVIAAPCQCEACGSGRIVKLGEDITETLEIVPRQWKVIQTVREKFSCRDCERISQPPAPFHPTPRGWAGPNLLATILFEKFGQHQPLNRQAERYAREGVELSLSTLADQVGAAAAALAPLHGLIAAHVLAAERLHGDDTPVPVLAKGKTDTGRLWVYVRDDRPFAGGAPPAALYRFSRDRRGEHPQAHLAGWSGILQADAYAGFGGLYDTERQPGPITEALCWSHARRKFFELADIAASARRGKQAPPVSPTALEAVKRIDAIFDAERTINGLAAEARLSTRRVDVAPLVADLEAWMRRERAALSRHAPVAKAMDYMLRRWDGFAGVLADGKVCLTNNAAERALRGVALGRKAWLFAGSDRGGDRAAFMYSMIATAKLNNVDPQAWLADVLGRIAGTPMAQLDELLPWKWSPTEASQAALPAALGGGLQFTCWNGEVVRSAFVLDAHDREVIAWYAVANAGISGSDIRDMMLEAVEARFGGIRAPHPVEWLSDNGSIYTAHDTRVFATQLNLVPCFTPVKSPESNGMSEAFVKTLKRDYLRVSPVPDAETALDQIAGWFDDYNEHHPHSGLRMRSPREFRRAHQPAEVSG